MGTIPTRMQNGLYVREIGVSRPLALTRTFAMRESQPITTHATTVNDKRTKWRAFRIHFKLYRDLQFYYTNTKKSYFLFTIGL